MSKRMIITNSKHLTNLPSENNEPLQSIIVIILSSSFSSAYRVTK